MKKIKLDNLKVTSFVTTITPAKSKTIKGGGLTDDLPVCNPNESTECTVTEGHTCNSSGDTNCTSNAGSIVRSCVESEVANCPRSGANAGTVVGCTLIC